jgi:hypothetical protein
MFLTLFRLDYSTLYKDLVIPHSECSVLPLDRPFGESCVGAWWLPVVEICGHINKLCGKNAEFIKLNLVEHIAGWPVR